MTGNFLILKAGNWGWKFGFSSISWGGCSWWTGATLWERYTGRVILKQMVSLSITWRLPCLQQKAQPLSRVHRHCGFSRNLLLLFTSLAQAHQSTSPCALNTTPCCVSSLHGLCEIQVSLWRFSISILGQLPLISPRFCWNVHFLHLRGTSRDPSEIAFSLSASLCLWFGIQHIASFFKKDFWCGPLEKFLLDLLPHCFQSFLNVLVFWPKGM